jgi:hypothetical protein
MSNKKLESRFCKILLEEYGAEKEDIILETYDRMSELYRHDIKEMEFKLHEKGVFAKRCLVDSYGHNMQECVSRLDFYKDSMKNVESMKKSLGFHVKQYESLFNLVFKTLEV